MRGASPIGTAHPQNHYMGTTVYVVMVNDRHRDPEPVLFSTAEAAIGYARERARDWLVEDDAGDDLGWLYYATHPSESDSVWVVPASTTS
jgi:hypothetical protein